MAKQSRSAAGPRPAAADDLYRLRFVSDPRLSPDGSRVAYVVSWVAADDRTQYRSSLMIANADGSEVPRSLTSGRFRDSAPRWSPPGDHLAFLSNRAGERSQLFVLPLGGGEPRQLTNLTHGAGAAAWSPDGTRLAFAAGVDIPEIAAQEAQPAELGKPPRVRIVTRVHYKADGEELFEARRRHIFVVGLAPDAEPRQVTDGDWDDADPAWSPDGRALVFVSNRERDRDLSALSDLWLMPAKGGKARRLTRHKGEVAAPAWSPDGQQVACLGHERGTTYGAATELLLVPTNGGSPRSVSAGYAGEIGNVALSDAREPSSPRPPCWAPDSASLFVLASSHGRVSVERFSTLGGQPLTVVGGAREVAAFTLSADATRVTFAASDPTHPYEVFSAAADGSRERAISQENAALLASVRLASVAPFQATSTDGVVVEGWLMEPAQRGKRRKLPLVLEVHGGPEAMYAGTFVHEFQVLAARGYGVLYTNPRGSKGYGEAFTARIFADWGNQDAADCLAAVDAAKKVSWVDADRLGVLGGSYGGFMTAWLVGHTDIFRAAVAMRGLYSFESFYGTSDIGPTFCDYVLGGPVYERRELYRERSPLTYAPAMRTPLLLIHSDSDLRCPIEQAEQLFVQLRRLGKVETELVRFPEENHNLSRSGRPDRRLDRLQRIVGWLDRHL